MRNYVCSICGKKNVKLWRPYMDEYPLVCAECAEKRQVPIEYDELSWETNSKKDKDCFPLIGKPTGKKLILPKWKVNEEGLVPSYLGPDHEGKLIPITDQLIIDLSDLFSSDNYSGQTTMIPACPNGDNLFYSYSSVPDDVCKWWKKLSTK